MNERLIFCHYSYFPKKGAHRPPTKNPEECVIGKAPHLDCSMSSPEASLYSAMIDKEGYLRLNTDHHTGEENQVHLHGVSQDRFTSYKGVFKPVE